jgi:uncharacterized linocin/CFP29 family protein
MTVTIGRRELLAALGGAAAAWPLVALRARLVQRRAIEQVMRHEHESRPHDIDCANPKVVVVEDAVFVAGVMVE